MWSKVGFGIVLSIALALNWTVRAVAQPIQTVSTSEAAKLLAASDGVLLLDIREREEYLVSRISGAFNVIPSADIGSTTRRLARIIAGKTVIVYCTLGMRSSDFATFADRDLMRLGARAILVLTGGIIAWHNEKRPLVDRHGLTKFIHPFRSELIPSLAYPQFARLAPSR